MTDLEISSKIYEIRGKQVMLDSDLAKLYNCKNGTKSINLAVKRHINRFPERFMFQLTEEECESLRFQIETSKEGSGGRRYIPYVFTEQGVAMLSAVLNSNVAEEVSIRIMDAFILMRHFIGNNLLDQKYVSNMLLKHDSEIKELQDCFDKFEEKELFLDKIYDAYSTILDIFKSTKKELIIVDRYTDKSLLDIIKQLKCNVILITSNKTKLTKLDIDKYNKTYNNLKIIYDESYHDRYFIIDRNTIYHSGNSINHIGYRKSNINLITDKKIKDIILNDIDNIKKNIK